MGIFTMSNFQAAAGVVIGMIVYNRLLKQFVDKVV